MKFVVKIIDAPGIPGGKALALCTEFGETVGMQTRCTIENEVAEIGVVTVQFYIDGDQISFAENDG